MPPGEWIASDWPVCALSDMAAPRRMGAALTYARRYALFTLVGIAGEDDLDAPDLGGQPVEGSGKPGNGLDAKRQNGNGADQPLGTFAASRKPWSPPKQALEPEKSAALRDRLLGEISALASQEQATAWAQKAMAAKNTLTTADCGVVEAAFAARVAELADDGAGDPALSLPSRSERPSGEFALPARVNNAVAWHIDKGALTLSEPRRYRDRAHLRFVSAQPCLVCGRRPSDAHHLRFAQPRALGRRVSDEYTVPLCRSHHRALHRHGDESAWWETNKVDPVVVARELWQRTRLDGPSGGRAEALLSVGVIESPDATRTGLSSRRLRSTSQGARVGRPMTSFRQIEANRRNALRSTGPKTEEGKRQSRRNALRHGLTAETVIDGLEDSEDYRAFEAAVIADYDARTAVERELVLRLASLLWRLRRIISIETDLLRIQSEIVHERRAELAPASFPVLSGCVEPGSAEVPSAPCEGVTIGSSPMSARELTYCFLRLGNVDNGAFERLGRYNAVLWKQTRRRFFCCTPSEDLDVSSAAYP